MKRILCIKNFEHYIKGYFYTLINGNNDEWWIIDHSGNCQPEYSFYRSGINFNEYFITDKKLRKQKLKKLYDVKYNKR